MRWTGLVCAALTLGAAASLAPAALIVYEGFDYPGGAIAPGAAGGTGWANNWDAAMHGGSGLAHGDLTTSGGAAVGPPTGASNPNRPFAGISSGTLWFSYLVDTRSGSYAKFMLRDTNWGRPIWIGSEPWESTMHTTQNVDNLSLGTRNQQYLVIGRLDFNAGTTANNEALRLWALPSSTDPSETAPSDGSATLTDLDVTNVGTLVRAEFHVSGASAFDEIRLGTTYEDVAPIAIPEPIAAAALPLAGLFLGRRRRVGSLS